MDQTNEELNPSITGEPGITAAGSEQAPAVSSEPVIPPAAPPPNPPPVRPPPPPPPPSPTNEFIPQSPPPPRPRKSFLRKLGNILLFLILFAVGIWLSTALKQYLPQGTSGNISPTTTPILPGSLPTPTPAGAGTTWQTYQVLNGVTAKPVEGISFRLPGDLLEPICDGSNCVSQGTYLPGGTRFTIAARGPGQVLRDFRGSVISDLAGTPFTTKPTTIKGRPAVEYSGNFVGTTLSGYGFSQMRGVMIELSDKMSLELNHFLPNGIAADFAADDQLFEQILATLEFSGLAGIAGEKGSILPTLTPVATSSPTIFPSPTISSLPTGD